MYRFLRVDAKHRDPGGRLRVEYGGHSQSAPVVVVASSRPFRWFASGGVREFAYAAKKGPALRRRVVARNAHLEPLDAFIVFSARVF